MTNVNGLQLSCDEYTEFGKTLIHVPDSMRQWGLQHEAKCS